MTEVIWVMDQGAAADFDIMALGASALIELAMGCPMVPREDETAQIPKSFAPTEETKPSGPVASVSAPRQNRASLQAKPSPVSSSVKKQLTGNIAPGEVMHTVLPRRKAGELDGPEREAVVVTPEVLESLFQHPLAVASQKLGLSATTIKKLCRKLGINKWPYKSPFRTPRSSTGSLQKTGGSKRLLSKPWTTGQRPRSVQSSDEEERTPSPVQSAERTPSPSSPQASGPSEPAEEGEGRRVEITSLVCDVTSGSPVDAAQANRKRSRHG